MTVDIGTWARAVRPQFLTVTAAAVGLGWTSALLAGLPLQWGKALLTLLGALCAHAGANVVNDYHDRDADADNPDRLFPYTGGSRIIQEARMSARAMAVYGYALAAVTMAIGIGLAAAGNARLLLVGAAGLALAIAYSAPPLRLSGRGWGEAVVASAWLLVVVGADLVQRAAWSAQPVLIGMPVACLVAAILWVNEYPDHAADRRAGKHTMVVRLGRIAAARVHLALVLFAHVWLIVVCALGALPAAALYGLLSLPLSLFAACRLLAVARVEGSSPLLPVIKTTILAAHVHAIALASGLLLAARSG